jgi:ribosomal protein S12 methylthiotransferase
LRATGALNLGFENPVTAIVENLPIDTELKRTSLKKEHHTIRMVTLGCSKNLYDSEVLLGHLKANKIRILKEHERGRADTVIINTCGFIGDARQESVETILAYIEKKREGVVRNVYVMGCLIERYRDSLMKEIPEIDAVFGVNDMAKILNSVGAEFRQNLISERVITTPPHYAYLKIAEGCNRICSFCAIPKIRGRHISRTIGDILDEARMLADKGVKELILISQDLTYYGLDLYEKKMLPDLVEKLSDLNLHEWIRLQYLHPATFTDRLLDVIAERENICNYIDIPLQHINDRILDSMHRGIDSLSTYKLLEKIRKKLPEAAIRSSFIVGYPGETQSEFNELISFIKNIEFDRVGVFTYSHEEDTDAFNLPDNVTTRVKHTREALLMEVQQEISLKHNQAKIGKEFKVLIDYAEDGDFLTGRTEFDSPEVDNEVTIQMEEAIRPGTFQKIKITDATEFDLIGEIIK